MNNFENRFQNPSRISRAWYTYYTLDMAAYTSYFGHMRAQIIGEFQSVCPIAGVSRGMSQPDVKLAVFSTGPSHVNGRGHHARAASRGRKPSSIDMTIIIATNRSVA